LYFSSNGHANIGGLDVFSVERVDKKWSEEIVHEGVPMNSSADDFYMALDEKGIRGFMVSNREGSKSLKGLTTGDDLYSVKLKPDCPLVIKGYVTECEDPQRMPIQDVEVSLYKVLSDKNFEFVDSRISSEVDLFYMTVEPGAKYKINSIKDGYWPSVEEIETPEEHDCDTVFQLICVKRIQVIRKVKNVYFAFDKDNVREIYKDEMDSIYNILADFPTYMVEIGGHTDAKGSEGYNIVLSKKRAKAAATYLVEQGVQEERIITKGYGESQPIAPNTLPDGSDNPVGRAKNRRVEFKVIKEVEDEIQIEYVENEPESTE
jgi:outer membrane protein OmpA-like peptidoglycan-associated protein